MSTTAEKKPDAEQADAGRKSVASADSTAPSAPGQGALSTAALDDLVESANAAHAACQQAIRSALHHAKDCGEILLRAKELVGHGHFTAWITVKCSFSPRQARNYMTIARNWEKLTKRKRAADLNLESLSVRAALRILASDSQDWVYGDGICPACGERMVFSSRWYQTCPACWDCKLYPRPQSTRSHETYRIVRTGREIQRHFGRLADPTQRADVLVSLFAMVDDDTTAELVKMLGSGRSERRRVAAGVIEQLGTTLPLAGGGGAA